MRCHLQSYKLADFEKNLRIKIPATININPKTADASRDWLYLKYPTNEINKIPIPLHIAYVTPTDKSFNVRDKK